ncbi:MAG: hypothetical protein OXI83_06450 [Gemmatimonadota bacterium]|nr:hypothetical protein [Gemmatimonadota bacterium]
MHEKRELDMGLEMSTGALRVSSRRTPHHLPAIVAASCALLAAACGPVAERVPDIAIDSAGVQIVTSHPADSDATCAISDEPTAAIGEDEGDETQWFSSIRGAGRLSDGSIVVVDRNSAEVRIYDEIGGHLRTMGRHGEGPGEFQDPFLLWITAGDTLWVGDYRPWRYNLFTSQGEFVRQVNLTPILPNPPQLSGVLDNGYSLNASSKRARNENFSVADTLMVLVYDPGGGLVGNLARIPDRTGGQVSDSDLWLFPLFQSFAEVDAGGSTVVLGHGSETEVRVLDDEFNLRLILRWTEPDREVTSADVRAWREDYIARRSRLGEREWGEFDDARISPERPVAELFPAIGSIMIGRDGRIWIAQYDRPREDLGWLAFEPDGRFLCHLPARIPGSVREFGADYVLLQRESELGVQSVHLHRLEVP